MQGTATAVMASAVRSGWYSSNSEDVIAIIRRHAHCHLDADGQQHHETRAQRTITVFFEEHSLDTSIS